VVSRTWRYTPDHNPKAFFETALTQGYRIISLSYITEPAVAQICTVGPILRNNPDCANLFRKKRTYGDPNIWLLPDQPQDAIVYRLKMLLQDLAHMDLDGHWEQYLKDDQINWEKIAVSGQSQGGGMAEYLVKYENLARVISFSGKWDYSSPREIAKWYFISQRTPV
jgi:hypothetical protein